MSSSFHASTVDWLGSWIAAGQVKPGQTIKVEADLGRTARGQPHGDP